jgi:hypothetical protein
VGIEIARIKVSWDTLIMASSDKLLGCNAYDYLANLIITASTNQSSDELFSIHQQSLGIWNRDFLCSEPNAIRGNTQAVC